MEGYREGYYWALKNDEVLKHYHPDNEHGVWTLQRFFVYVICNYSAYMLNDTLWLLIILPLCFPFFHDGMYYYERNVIDGSYPKGWWDFSKTSTSWFTKFSTPILRTLYFVIATTLITLLFICPTILKLLT